MAENRDYGSRKTLTRQERLRKQDDFNHVLENGKRFSGRSLIVIWISNALEYPRLGVIVSRKHGNAVQRNRIKRRFRAIFRNNRFRISAPVDLVMIPKIPSAESRYRDFEDDFIRFTEQDYFA